MGGETEKKHHRGKGEKEGTKEEKQKNNESKNTLSGKGERKKGNQTVKEEKKERKE